MILTLFSQLLFHMVVNVRSFHSLSSNFRYKVGCTLMSYKGSFLLKSMTWSNTEQTEKLI